MTFHMQKKFAATDRLIPAVLGALIATGVAGIVLAGTIDPAAAKGRASVNRVPPPVVRDHRKPLPVIRDHRSSKPGGSTIRCSGVRHNHGRPAVCRDHRG
jgi:hypothetical protein